jgi:hypothetical protein
VLVLDDDIEVLAAGVEMGEELSSARGDVRRLGVLLGKFPDRGDRGRGGRGGSDRILRSECAHQSFPARLWHHAVAACRGGPLPMALRSRDRVRLGLGRGGAG